MLHQKQRGMAILWQRDSVGKGWIKLPPSDPRIPDLLRAREGRNDTYITPNEFDGWRLVRLLRSLRACYVDLDGCTDIYAVLDALTDQQKPHPSAILFSGRGLHLYWLLEALPSQALPVWQRIQDELIRSLANLGADSSAKDCTRLLRLSGTKNAKNGEEVIGHVLDGHRWSLRQLAFEVLGRDGRGHKPAAVVRDLRARRAHPDREIKGSIYARWHLVFQDLVRISEHHSHQVPQGYRDKWLFICGAALSWFTHPQGIEAEITSLGRLHTDLEAQDFAAAAKQNVSRALDAAAGKKITWHGQEIDPRYRFKRQTLYDWLSPIIAPELLPKLRAIVPDNEAAIRKQNRDRTRNAHIYTKNGVRADNREKRAQARAMREGGASFRQIAAEIGVSYESVRKWCREGVNQIAPCIAPRRVGHSPPAARLPSKTKTGWPLTARPPQPRSRGKAKS
jgi:hypothetical protein